MQLAIENLPNPNPPDNNPPTVVYHGKSWYEDDAKKFVDINGPIPSSEWAAQDAIGERLLHCQILKGSCQDLIPFC